MSGMVGIMQLDRGPVDPHLLRQMTAQLTLRGPEAQHTWYAGSVGLGHTLLTTVNDVDPLPQPCSLDGQVWITADARIDGRAELLDKLRSQRRDVNRRTPDAVLILHAYHVWGTACLQHLIGDFAFALWDERHQRLFCARDHFGVVPFFYAQVGALLIVSNTLNCIRLHPDVPDLLNEQTIADTLLFMDNRRFDTTFWRAIQRLPPAHTLLAEGGQFQIRRYWQPPEVAEYQRYKRPELYVEHFRELFAQAVGDRLRSDRVVAELSGGMDSSSIVATACHLQRTGDKAVDLRTQTIATRSLLAEEEGNYAAQTAHTLQIPHKIFYFEDYELDSPPAEPAFVPPEPAASMSANTSVIAHYHRAAAYAPVLLSGLGGDQALAAAPYRWPYLQPGNSFTGLLADLNHYRRVFGMQRPSGLGLTKTFRDWQKRKDNRLLPFPEWLQPDLVERLDLRRRKAHFDEIDSARVQRRGMTDYTFWSTAMQRCDAAYTSVPLKLCYPFFDVRLLRYLNSIPPMPWLQHKALLRLAMRGLLPESIVTRPKTPLTRSTNLEHTLALRQTATWQLDLLNEPALAPYVVADRLQALIQAPQKTDHGGYRLANVAVYLAYWLRHRVVSPYSAKDIAPHQQAHCLSASRM